VSFEPQPGVFARAGPERWLQTQENPAAGLVWRGNLGLRWSVNVLHHRERLARQGV